MIYVCNIAFKKGVIKRVGLGTSGYEDQPFATIVNIMRGTALGNPFKIDADTPRKKSIEKYRKWLFNALKHVERVQQEFDRLLWIYLEEGDLILECCCHPKECHGDIIRSALEWAETIGRDEWLNVIKRR